MAIVSTITGPVPDTACGPPGIKLLVANRAKRETARCSNTSGVRHWYEKLKA
jgi:hypothetical protein